MNKKTLTRAIAAIAFYLASLFILIWTAQLSYAFISKALPHMPPYVPAFALILFDGGMLVWMVVFLHYAEGTGQRAIALLTCVLDLIGVGVLSFAEIMLGGQQLAEVPVHLGEYAIYAIGAWTMANVVAIVLFHLLSPEARRQMAQQAAEDQIYDEALSQTQSKTEAIAAIVAGELSDAMVENITRQVRSKVHGGHSTKNAVPDKSSVTPAPAHAHLQPPTIPIGSGPAANSNGHKEDDAHPL